MEINKTGRYEELDALRGIAALMVVFFHFTMGNGHNNLFKLGATGVDLFFIISGFVIYMSLCKIDSSKDFIINRVSRLFPTYWASVTFTFCFVLFQSNNIFKENFINYFGNMTMFQYYLHIPDLDSSYWTMIVEIIFYISMLLLYQLKLFKYLNSIGIILCLITVFIVRYFCDTAFVNYLANYLPLVKFIPLFFAGTVFYKIYTEKTKIYLHYSIIFLCLLSQLYLFSFSEISSCFLSFSEYCGMLLLFFILFIAFVNHKLKFIVNKTTLFLGKISFALYLIHQYISVSFIIPFLVNRLNINFWIASIVIDLPIVICMAALITHYVEVPMRIKMKEKLRAILA